MSTSTRHLILNRCFDAIQANGFETLRTDKEIARLKITKGAFYHYFPNKLELGYAVVDEVMLPFYTAKWAPLIDIENGIPAAIHSILETEKTKATETTIKRGDVLSNLILEQSHSDELFRQKLEIVNEVQIKILQRAIMIGRAAGELKNQTDARSMALYIIGQVMGCYTIGKVRASKETFVSMVGTLQKQLNEILILHPTAPLFASNASQMPSSSNHEPSPQDSITAKPTEKKASKGKWFSKGR